MVGMVGSIGSNVGECFHKRTFITLYINVLFDVNFLVVSFPLTVKLNLFVNTLGLMPCLRVVNFVPAVILTVLGTTSAKKGF